MRQNHLNNLVANALARSNTPYPVLTVVTITITFPKGLIIPISQCVFIIISLKIKRVNNFKKAQY